MTGNVNPETRETELRSYCLFQDPWWLDAVAPGAWHEVLVENGGRTMARLPYFIKKKYGFTAITMPRLTMFMGPWLQEYNGKYANRISHEKQMMYQLIGQLPPCSVFRQNFHYEINNWQPFFWKGFKQTTRYSYVIDDLSNLERIYEQFLGAKRKDIKKASRIVEVKHDLAPERFYENHKMTLARQGRRISYPFDLFNSIYRACYDRNSGRVIYCEDEKGNMHSAIFFVWDHRSAFYLISTIDPEFRNSGSASLLIWEAIKYCSTRTGKFDFEGSMIEPVANSFRAFGARLQPHSFIYKVNSPVLKVASGMKQML